ncbi:hypothetical protein M2360_000620 [Rhizobium sp. SG_E_25_P2]|uniref:DUF4160 domain-containing protein n=1 Tax=Rhizobium sp. SG_E_25_P2 TaxID=2879942 RepID=UPI0024753F0E|nr:DUF4160 domain-containing protein [Rhizobium sp. SG_E_25_P2]MDH6265239.1 hypothetical protein [Rhizobium sp. SG_E_25_P2]
MPTVLRKYGYRFHFYGSDMHEPPHIHVTGHGGKAKVWLATAEFAEASGLNNAEKRRILDAIHEHRREMMEAWNEFFRSVS